MTLRNPNPRHRSSTAGFHALVSLVLALAFGAATGGCGIVGCIEAGTNIATPAGPRVIEDLRVGDAVWSWDLEAERQVARRVTAVQSHLVWPISVLSTADGAEFGITDNHPVYDAGLRHYVAAGELAPDAQLLRLAGRRVQHVAAKPGGLRRWLPGRVYDLSVEGPEHNYFAGGVLVHNKEPPFLIQRALTPLPPDLSTAVGAGAQLLLVPEASPANSTVSDNLIAVKPHVRLVTWPELTPVDAAVEDVTETISPRHPNQAALRLVPAKPLADRWHAVHVKQWPAGWQGPAGANSLHGWAPGKLAPSLARFRPDQWPVVRMILLCPKAVGAMVYVELSEPLTPPTVPLTITQAGKDLGCKEMGSKSATFAVTCKAWVPNQPMDLALQPGAVAPNGKELGLVNGPAPTKWTVTEAALPTGLSSGCKEFRP